MKSLGSLIALIITVVAEFLVLTYIRVHSSKKNKLVKTFEPLGYCMIIWCTALIVQILVINFVSEKWAVYIDYIPDICVAFMPFLMFLFAKTYESNKFTFKLKYSLLLIVPLITTLIICTNYFHHLFYVKYSTTNTGTEFGPYFYIHSIYTYGFFFYDIFKILKNSIKRTSYKSKQTLLIILGILCPLIINISGLFDFITMTVYLTPISFSITIILWGIAILKYNFLSIAPIALKTVVAQMSDAYVVLNTDYIVSDCNKAFEDFFHLKKQNVVGKEFKSLNLDKDIVFENSNVSKYIETVQNTKKIYKINAKMKNESRYFNIEISGITADGQFVGVLILIKDTTQHVLDMKTLKDNQNTLMERERLATLGQMIGGIAHNLKTPIMSIAGAMEGMQDLVTEYDKSIDDPEVTKEDHHAIAHDMKDWISKVNTYDAYMSDVITAVKGQTVNFNDSTVEAFTIKELLKDVNILMKHELKSALIMLDVDCKVDENTTLHGNVNSLVQVVNNLISNAIQSYNGKQNEEILLTISQKNNNIVIAVRDHGSGIPEDVQKKLFNEMITTKGHKGTGLGLFMSYSTIKGHFNGNLSFKSKVGEGTTFYIELPIK